MSPLSIKINTSLKRSSPQSFDAPPPKRKLPWLMSQTTSHTMSRHTSLDPLEVAPLLNFYTPQRMIDITVLDDDETDEFGDPEEQVFTIHHNILAHFSLSFRKTLNADPKCNNITIHGCESAFGLLQNWFYTQKIQGPTGAIKLLEYAKLWQLASTLSIKDLAPLLLDLMYSTKPGQDEEKGNTLEDFQAVAYVGKDRGLEDMAIEKTFSAMNELNIDRILKNMPDVMRPSFMLAMMKGCVALPGWNEGCGFEGVNVSRRGNSARASIAYQVQNAKTEVARSIYGDHFFNDEDEEDDSSENESDGDWHGEVVPETGLFGYDEVVEGTPAMMEKEHTKEVDTEMEQMLMYDDEEPEYDAQEYFAEPEDEEESSDETEEGEN